MKKGFTIVELAIVLVVIGIILGMAVKGKALVDAARMRAEVAKMNKFEAAAYIYYADTNNMPAPVSNTDAYIPLATLVGKELLTNGDRNEKIGGGFWGLYRCAPNATTPATHFADNATGGNVCVVGLSVDPQGLATTTAYAAGIPARLACNIEIMKDDENASNGEGRGWRTPITYTTGAASATNMPPANYRNCDNYTTGLNVVYGFRVF